VFSARQNLVLVVTAVLLALQAACERGGPPATQPARGGTTAALTRIAPESRNWSKAEAAEKLADEQLGLSAAVRLVRLAGATPLCLPETLTDNQLEHLRLARLGTSRWVLGVTARDDVRRLRAPVLLSADGDVELLGEGVEEELTVLYLAGQPDVFPHVAILPDRVLLTGDETEPAIVLEPDELVHFECRERNGYPYLALVLPRAAAAAAEVAAYKWDPSELVFVGPAVDALPDPPGGRFHIDVAASRRLEPMGGELPDTQPIQRPPASQPRPPVQDSRDLPA
jgi:hypothetical protein